MTRTREKPEGFDPNQKLDSELAIELAGRIKNTGLPLDVRREWVEIAKTKLQQMKNLESKKGLELTIAIFERENP